MVIQPLSTRLIKPNFCFDFSHRRSTTVSLETRNSKKKCLFLHPKVSSIFYVSRPVFLVFILFFSGNFAVSHVALVRGQSFSVRFPRRVWTSVLRMPQDLATRSPTNVQFVLSWMKEWSTTLLQLSNLCPILRIPSPEWSPCLEANAPTSRWTPLKTIHFWPRRALIMITPLNLCDYLVLAPFKSRFLCPWNARMWNTIFENLR